MANVLFLHGASSSGKTTLAQEILGQASAPLWHLSIDHLRDAGIWRMEQFGQGRAEWRAYRERYFAGFHAAIAAVAKAGNDILLEHILDTPHWVSDLRQGLADQNVFFVRLDTPEDVLRARETARADRPEGSAVKDASHIHKGLTYDLTLKGTTPVMSNVAQLRAAWDVHLPPSAFFQEGL